MRNVENTKTIHSSGGTVTTKTKYKDYMEFLHNYSNKRDEVDSVSSEDSGFSNGTFKLNQCKSNNTSSSSLNSEVSTSSFKCGQSMKTSYGSYKDFLENCKSKKFSSVRPVLANPKKNTVRSEIFIQVNGTQNESESATSTQNSAIKTSNGVSVKPDEPRNVVVNKVLNNRSANSFSNGTNQLESRINIQHTNPSVPVLKKLPQTNVSNGASPQTPPVNGVAKVSESSQNGYVPVPPKMPENLITNGVKPITNGNIPVPPKFPTNGTLPRSVATSINITHSKTIPTNGVKPADKREYGFIPPTPEFLESRLKKLNSVDPKSSQSIFDTTTIVPIVDENGKIDKNDPNVKKLVYNTYRGLLENYNNKANDMISTLPRNMVCKDKGITKQLESIALHGGLDKLNGRVHPNNLEKEEA